MIVIAACPVCVGPVALKAPSSPGRQAVYCSRRCHDRAAKRRQRGRQPAIIQTLSDDQLARIPHVALAFYGIDFA